jgi:hypothetical protein
LLAEVCAIIAIGHVAGTITEAENDAEWRKAITTELMTGRSFHVIDNVEGTLRSGILAALLTSAEWHDRLLSTNQSVTISASGRGAWAATGNNLLTGGDLARRCYAIRINPKLARPSQRPPKEFKHHPLTEWVEAERHRILHAALTACRAWFDRGCPVAGAPIMGSYEQWARTLWGILALDPTPIVTEDGTVTAARIGSAFLANGPDLWTQGDEDAEDWEIFLRALTKAACGEIESTRVPTFTAAAIADRVRGEYPKDPDLKDALPSALAADASKDTFTKRLGKAFRKQQGRRFGDEMLRLERAGEDPHTKVARWQILRGD